jgi:hypothetical protein
LGWIAEDHLTIGSGVKDREHDAGIASQPVEPGDDQRCLLAAARLHGAGKRRPITSLSALHLGIFADQFPPAPIQIVCDGAVLRFQADFGATRPACAGSEIGDEELARHALFLDPGCVAPLRDLVVL